MSDVTREMVSVLSGMRTQGNLLGGAREIYAANIVWVAPGRSVRIVGCDAVIAHQQREAAAMQNPEFTFLRRSNNERQVLEEFVVRFVYAGSGIDGAPVQAGDLVELKRLRILDVAAGEVSRETCIENWTVLTPAS